MPDNQDNKTPDPNQSGRNQNQESSNQGKSRSHDEQFSSHDERKKGFGVRDPDSGGQRQPDKEDERSDVQSEFTEEGQAGGQSSKPGVNDPDKEPWNPSSGHSER